MVSIPIHLWTVLLVLMTTMLLGCHQECLNDDECLQGYVCEGAGDCPPDGCPEDVEPGLCVLTDREACERTGGSWDETTCGHRICGAAPDCLAVIPGCDCGSHANFFEGLGCVPDPDCPCLEDADCGPGRICVAEGCEALCDRDEDCAGEHVCHDDGVCGEPLHYFTTCGDPVCRPPDGSDPGVEKCSDAVVVADACDVAGAICDAGLGCGQLVVCAADDPRTRPGGCPISRRGFKRDIVYLDDRQVDEIAADLRRIPLATWNYRQEPETTTPHLGFILEDVEPSPSVDSDRDRVDLYGALSMAVAAVQSQQRQIDALRAEVSALRRDEQVCRDREGARSD